MSRRVCLITVADDAIQQLISLLPPNVVITGSQPCFDKAATEMRLEGPGLPPWCEAPANGQPYAKGVIRPTEDGLRLICLSPHLLPYESLFQQAQRIHLN